MCIRIIRNVILIAVLVFFNIKNNQAQTFRGAVSVGLLGSQVLGDGFSGYKKAGIAGGLLIQRRLSDKWKWQMELQYVNKGSKKNPNYDIGDYTKYKISFHYIEVPLVLLYSYKYNIDFEIGCAPAFLFKTLQEDQHGVLDITRPFKDYDFSSILGVNYNITEKFVSNLRFTQTFFFSPIRNNFGNRKYWFNWGDYNMVLTISFKYFL